MNRSPEASGCNEYVAARTRLLYRIVSRLGGTMGNGTIYIDVPIPFTNIRLICDIGRHGTLGWGRRR